MAQAHHIFYGNSKNRGGQEGDDFPIIELALELLADLLRLRNMLLLH